VSSEEALRAKLEPQQIRLTLAFAGLFQMTHELIKSSVLEDVKGFYGHSPLDKGQWLYGEDTYKREVLALSPGKPFQASLMWLADAGGISESQVSRLEEVYSHRHELTHELGRILIDVNATPDYTLFIDAVRILRDIHRFWIQVEKDLGTFDQYGDVEIDQVQTGPIMLLELCLQACLADLLGPAESPPA